MGPEGLPATMQRTLPENRDGLTRVEWIGLWPGTVVDANDPIRRGRVRVRVDQVYGPADLPAGDQKIPDERLPWAMPGFSWGGDRGSGDFAVPPVGAGVWVAFWMGCPEYPVYLTGFAGEGDVPAPVLSAYGPAGPRTRLIRTPGGQEIEMRWAPGEEEIRIQAPITAPPAGTEPVMGGVVRLAHKGAERQVEIRTAGGNIIRAADLPTPGIEIVSPAQVSVTAQGIVASSTGSGPVNSFTFQGALGLTVVGVTTLALAAVTATIASLALTAPLVITGILAIGAAGAKFRLANEQLFLLLQDILHVQANHTHQVNGVQTGAGAVTSAPSNLSTATQIGSPPRAGPLTNVPAGSIVGDVVAMTSQNLTAN